jgi:hypothetical protein
MGGVAGGHVGMGPSTGFGHEFRTPGRFAFRQDNRFRGRAFARNSHFFPNNRFFVNRRFFGSNAVFVGFGFPYPYLPVSLLSLLSLPLLSVLAVFFRQPPRSRVYGSTFSEWFPKRRASTGKSRQEAYGSIGSTSASTSNCRPASAMGTEALLEKIFSDSGTCCGATMLLQPQPQSWNFHRTSDSHPYSGILWPSLTTVLGITTDRIDMLIMLGRYWRHRCWARGHWWYY